MRLTTRGRRLALLASCVIAFIIGYSLPMTPWWLR